MSQTGGNSDTKCNSVNMKKYNSNIRQCQCVSAFSYVSWKEKENFLQWKPVNRNLWQKCIDIEGGAQVEMFHGNLKMRV